MVNPLEYVCFIFGVQHTRLEGCFVPADFFFISSSFCLYDYLLGEGPTPNSPRSIAPSSAESEDMALAAEELDALFANSPDSDKQKERKSSVRSRQRTGGSNKRTRAPPPPSERRTAGAKKKRRRKEPVLVRSMWSAWSIDRDCRARSSVCAADAARW